MPLITRDSHYHVWHRPEFDGKAEFASETVSIKKPGGRKTGSSKLPRYSLKNDLDGLRKKAVAKGIGDAAVVDVGSSQGGRELWALKIGKGASHKILFTGCHHAREWISVEVPYLVAEYLVETYTDTPTTEAEKRIKHLLLNRQIWFVPMVNPDGHHHSTTANRNWRPNRNSHAVAKTTIPRSKADGGPVHVPAGTYTGVDINRNYATPTWGTETFHNHFIKTSRDPRDGGADSIWCGIAASGEPESKAIDALIRKHNFRASITYHSYSQLLLYPDLAETDVYVQWVGKGMEDLINQYGNPYTLEKGSKLYSTTGDLMEFSFNVVPKRPTFTPEVRPTHPPADPSWAFSGLPEDQIVPCFKENLAAALALINAAGHDTSATTNSLFPKTAMPATKVQVVRNAWEVFKGWAP